MRVSKIVLFSSAIVLSVSSCKVIQPYSNPNIATENLYRDQASTDTLSIAAVPWQEIFRDASLQNLIQQGIDNNLDLRSAYSRVRQAEAYFLQSKSAIWPSLDLNATVDHLPDTRSDATSSYQTQYQLGLSSAWELDIWGKLRSGRRADLANLLQTEAAAKAVQTRLVASIASYYYQLLTLDQQLAITEKTVSNWESTVSTMRALKESSRVTEAAVVQSEAQRYAAEVTIPDLKHRIKEIENAISILLGSSPSGIERGSITNQQIRTDLSTGVPSQLLANRPDVQQAEFNLRQYFELTNVARSFFYPSLSISASAGFNSTSLSELFDPGAFLARIGGGLTQPIFNRRLNKTRLEVAEAQQQEALYGFQQALLTAGQEVSDALSLYHTANEKIEVREKQIDALEKSVSYSQELLENGYANSNYTEVITARQSLLQAELSRVNDRLEKLNAMVNLYRSLGGGWK